MQNIRHIKFTWLTSPNLRCNPWIKYGISVVVVLLTMASLALEYKHPSLTVTDLMRRFCVPVLVGFDHLSSSFEWSRSVLVTLRIVSVLLIVAALILIPWPSFSFLAA